jgi:hypothetical protein
LGVSRRFLAHRRGRTAVDVGGQLDIIIGKAIAQLRSAVSVTAAMHAFWNADTVSKALDAILMKDKNGVFALFVDGIPAPIVAFVTEAAAAGDVRR